MFPHPIQTARVIACLLAVLAWPAGAGAAPVVISNRTPNKITFQLVDPPAPAQTLTVNAGDLVSLSVSDQAAVRFGPADKPTDLRLDGNSAYFFGADKSGGVELNEIGLVVVHTANQPAAPVPANGAVAAAVAPQPAAPIKPLTIPIKVLVDDDERTARNVWRGRLTRRIQAASDVLEQHCHVRLEIVAFEEWVSDNKITDFNQSLVEFERKVKPDPARVAIGFTSQYEIQKGLIHLGGTRGALHSHILIREYSNQINEPERLEVLLHEFGHFLGAVHSRETDSVMRPILGDRQARAKDFRIGYDPLNTLAMCLLVDDYRAKPVRTLSELPTPTREQLLNVYTTLGRAFPKDPTPERYIELLQLKP